MGTSGFSRTRTKETLWHSVLGLDHYDWRSRLEGSIEFTYLQLSHWIEVVDSVGLEHSDGWNRFIECSVS